MLMSIFNLSFTRFEKTMINCVLPTHFTFPFYYHAHPISLIAIKQLQKYLLNNAYLKEHFLNSDTERSAAGKMFGVLVVKNTEGELGYLSAFSGKLVLKDESSTFVPAVPSETENSSYYIDAQKEINDLNIRFEKLKNDLAIEELERNFKILQQEQALRVSSFRDDIIKARKGRKNKRTHAKLHFSEEHINLLNIELALESVAEKNKLKALKEEHCEALVLVENELMLAQSQIFQIKERRKELSVDLQRWIFKQYKFLNGLGEDKNLIDLFESPVNEDIESNQSYQSIPSGAGDCAAPKLMNYAYKKGYTLIAMAEFWWGASPKSAIRKHQQIYPACYSKCQPILNHMLQGLNVEDNPLLMNPAEGKQLDILFQDDDILVVNKPADFLSVPGKNITDSVYSRIKLAFPYATGPLIVHRLDMSTSGLMVLALTKDANKQLQKQFIKRTVTKRYVALLSNSISKDHGVVTLPLRVDLDDRPRQLVCYEYGKEAETHYDVISREKETTRVYFYPKTGRTHQLRVHAAHHLGLNAPIVGDDHYGNTASRLHLHAESLSFVHPATQKPLSFQIDADF